MLIVVGFQLANILSHLDCFVRSCFIANRNKVMRRQSTFILHHASHPWSRSRVLIWMVIILVIKSVCSIHLIKLVHNFVLVCSCHFLYGESIFFTLHGGYYVDTGDLICILLLQLCFLRQFKSSIKKSDYLALRLGFIAVGICFFSYCHFYHML